jgi:DNA polymerase III delta prime subunit
MIGDDFLWVEKYRPHTIKDTILPSSLKEKFQAYVDEGSIPNLILTGRSGIGKTTVARAMCDEIGADYIIINGSLNGNIGTLRNEILQFASSVSLYGTGRKYVILDEADYLNAESTQPALRNFMEEFARNCGFILTCNYPKKVIEALHSRTAVVEFKIPKAESAKIASEFFKRIISVLDSENVTYEKKAVAAVVQQFFPDWRRALNELQNYAATGTIDSGILVNLSEASFKELAKMLKDKNFTGVRKWAGENSDIESHVMFRQLYDTATTYIKPSSIPALILLLSKYQYQHSFAADPEINLVACFVEILIEVEFL